MSSYNATKKMLIFNILDILHSRTDADHTLTLADIKNILLTDYGMEAERKAIRRNIDDLIDYGFDINYREIERSSVDSKGNVTENNKCTDFYMNNAFTDSEIRYLIDSVLFSRHIPTKQRTDLIKKLEGLSNENFRSRAGHIETAEPDSLSSADLFYTIEVLDEAISLGRQVSFNYCEFGTDKKLHLRKDGKGKARLYTINPIQMAAKDGKYYLICNMQGFDDIANYRIDRIKNIELTDTPCNSSEKFTELKKSFRLGRHMTEHIYMFQNESETVTFRMQKYLLNDVIDAFGKDITFFDEDENEISARVNVNLDAMRKWALQYALHAKVLSPQSLVDEVKGDIKKAYQSYGL